MMKEIEVGFIVQLGRVFGSLVHGIGCWREES